MENKINERHCQIIEDKLDDILAECLDWPQDCIVQKVLETLDKAQEKGWLNDLERIEARKYVREFYGVDC